MSRYDGTGTRTETRTAERCNATCTGYITWSQTRTDSHKRWTNESDPVIWTAPGPHRVVRPLDSEPNLLLMELRSLSHPRLNALRRLATLLIITALTGAPISIALCWFAAWDLSIPAEQPGGLFGRGPSFDEPTLLGGYRRIIPQWACAQWAYDQKCLAPLESMQGESPDRIESRRDGEVPAAPMGYFITDNVLVRFEVGEGFYDRVVRTTAGLSAPTGDELDSNAAVGVHDWLSIELAREVDEPTTFELRHPYPAWLGSQAVGTRMRSMGNATLWSESDPQSDMTVRQVSPTSIQPLEPDSQLWRMTGSSVFSREVVETRLYGWPLRCMSVQGVRIQRWTVPDPDRDDRILVSQDDHWTNAFFDFKHHSNWSFDADQPPATGLPWKPMWLPFLANSLILGAPVFLVATGSTRALGWVARRMRSFGNKCPNCGYPRSGIARETACPECGVR